MQSIYRYASLEMVRFLGCSFQFVLMVSDVLGGGFLKAYFMTAFVFFSCPLESYEHLVGNGWFGWNSELRVVPFPHHLPANCISNLEFIFNLNLFYFLLFGP